MNSAIPIGIIVIGVALQLLNQISNNYKTWSRKHPIFKKIFFWGSMILIIYGGFQSIKIYNNNRKYKIFASPAEIILFKGTNKDFILDVTNNHDFTLYDLNLSICANSKSFDMTLVDIMSHNEIIVPGNPSIIGWNCTNGYKGFKFESIKPHSTKQFQVRIRGQRIKYNVKFAFTVTSWETEPSDFSFMTTPELAADKTKDFQDNFNDNIKESDKNVQANFKLITMDKNLYFPEIKEFPLKSTFVRY